mgnify:CR=1 FL=1
MGWTLIAVLIILGLLFMVLEILIIPGTSVAGILGFICMGIGIWQSFATHGTEAGFYTLAVTLIATFLSLYFSLKSKTWKRFMLNDQITSRVNVISEETIKPGDKGIAISRLAPAGTIEINGIEVEAHTFGEFVNPGTEVSVIRIENNKVIVKTQ